MTPTPPSNRKRLTRQLIAEAAIKIADQDGIAALSMRRVASALKVSAMSLYNHVENKEALLALMLNEVAAKFDSPQRGQPWPGALRRRAISMRAAFLSHPWAPRLMLSQIALEPAILADLDATLACLVEDGLTYAQADWVRNSVDSHVYGFTMQELNMPVASADYGDAARSALPAIDPQAYPFVTAAAQEIISGRYDGVTEFTFGLDIVLEGLRRWQARL